MKNTNRTNTGLAKRIISLVCAMAALLMVGVSLISCGGAPEAHIDYDSGVGRDFSIDEVVDIIDEAMENEETDETVEEVPVGITCTFDGEVITISGKGRMDDFIQTATYCPWEDYISTAKKIVIEDGITNIGARAFYGANSVEEVIIPDSVTEIGRFAFMYCKALRSITIPDSVTIVGAEAFYGCDSLSEVTLSAGMTEIPKNMFGYCYGLETIVIPGNIKTISEYAFNYSHLKNVTICDGVEKLEYEAFGNCMYLESVEIPSSVTEMDPGAFFWCFDLVNIVIDNVEGSFELKRIGNEYFDITFTK